MADHSNNQTRGVGCYDTYVANPNLIWRSESVLQFYLPTLAAQVAFIVFTTRFLYYILRPFNQPLLVVMIIVSMCVYKFVFMHNI